MADRQPPGFDYQLIVSAVGGRGDDSGYIDFTQNAAAFLQIISGGSLQLADGVNDKFHRTVAIADRSQPAVAKVQQPVIIRIRFGVDGVARIGSGSGKE